MKITKNQIEDFFKEIEKYDQILILRHVSPDGDALGSQFGLKKFLELRYPEKKFYAIGDEKLSKSFREIFPKFDSFDSNKKDFLAIILDTANTERINDDIYKKSKSVIKIDHHPNLDNFGSINIIDDKASSTCEIISYMITFENKSKINSDVSKYLSVGIITDTNRFYFDITRAETFIEASKHFPNTNISQIYELLDKITLKEFLLFTKIVKLTKFTNGVAICIVPKWFSKIHNLKKGVSKIYVNKLMESFEIRYVLLSSYNFEEQVWKGSLRSKDNPINDLATKYNGGGHKKASGFTLKSKKQIKNLSKELIEIANSISEENINEK